MAVKEAEIMIEIHLTFFIAIFSGPSSWRPPINLICNKQSAIEKLLFHQNILSNKMHSKKIIIAKTDALERQWHLKMSDKNKTVNKK
jgi:hypothetical protein